MISGADEQQGGVDIEARIGLDLAGRRRTVWRTVVVTAITIATRAATIAMVMACIVMTSPIAPRDSPSARSTGKSL